MARDLSMNIYHELDITDLSCVREVISWCEENLSGGWNVVADSGSRHCRGDGRHCVTLLCNNLADISLFKMTWK